MQEWILCLHQDEITLNFTIILLRRSFDQDENLLILIITQYYEVNIPF